MTTHFDPKEGRPVKYPGEADYPQKTTDDAGASPTKSRHLDRGQKVIAILVGLMIAVVLIWGGAEWLSLSPTD